MKSQLSSGFRRLVAKKWEIILDPSGNPAQYAVIEGRKAGPIAFLLSHFKLDHSMTWVVSDTGVEQRNDSAFEKASRFVPYQSVSAISSGFAYPIRQAITIFLLAGTLGGAFAFQIQNATRSRSSYSDLYSYSSLGDNLVSYVGGALAVGALFALVFLFTQKHTTVEVTENSGGRMGFSMRRSIIEGQEVNLARADELRDLMRFLALEALTHSTPTSVGTSRPAQSDPTPKGRY